MAFDSPMLSSYYSIIIRMDLQRSSFALKSDQLQGVNQICKVLIDEFISEDRQDSMTIMFLQNPVNDPPAYEGKYFSDKSLEKILSASLNDEQVNLTKDKKICIDPLCFEQSREQFDEKNHKDHKTITLNTLLQDLKTLKCNQNLKRHNKQKAEHVISSLDKIYSQIQAFQNQILAIIKNAKIKAFRHISQVKKSFDDVYYQKMKKKVLENFNYRTAMHALGQIDKFKMLNYHDLDYPLFKINIIGARIHDNDKENKEKCLKKIEQYTQTLLGYHPNYTKVFNRSIQTFMFKSLSEKKIFSYYLRSPDYNVTNLGKKLRRIGFDDKLPLNVIEKKLSSSKILIRVNKKGRKGVVIGCGVLKEMEKAKFDNCYQKGFFLHSNGIVFSETNQTKNIFNYTQGDIISIHKEDYRIYFHKIKDNRMIDGFYVNLRPFEEQGTLNKSENYYAAVLLQGEDSELQVFL